MPSQSATARSTSWATRTALGAASAAVLFAWSAPSDSSQQRLEQTWRVVGRDGMACVSCHTPGAREVWDSGSALEDVTRRALNHVSTAHADVVTAAVAAVRKAHPGKLSTASPFAPKGGSLPGATPEQRDEAFGREVAELAPMLAGGIVRTLEQAQAAARQLVSYPLADVRPGLALDPVSRDPVRELDGPALGDWIPDVGLSQEATQAFVQAVERGRRPDGSYDLVAIDQAVRQAGGAPKNGIESLAEMKRLALLDYTAFLETNRRPVMVAPTPQAFEDPIWGVGDFFRVSEGQTPEDLGLADGDAFRMGIPPDQKIHFAQSAISWFWVAWTIDPSLQHASGNRKARSGQYMAQEFWDAGPYPWHAAYFAARRPIEQWNEDPGHGALDVELNAFTNNDSLTKFEPGASKDRFAAFCTNLLCMHGLLLDADLASGKQPGNVYAPVQQLTALWNFVQTRIPASEAAAVGAIVAKVTVDLDRLKGKRAGA